MKEELRENQFAAELKRIVNSTRKSLKFRQFYLLFNDLQILPTVLAESQNKENKIPQRCWQTEEKLRQEFEHQKEIFILQQADKFNDNE